MKIIIGASGYIGRGIFRHFSKKEKVVGTYYKHSKEGLKYFDLKNPNLDELGVDLKDVECVIITSSINKISECETEEAREINIEGTKKLIEQLFEKNIRPVFLSSDSVYSGEKGNYNEEDETNPVNSYGKQKKIIEDFLIESCKEFLILRLSKVFDLIPKNSTFLTSWAEQLIEDKEIKCFDDQIISLIYYEDLIKILDFAVDNLTGIYNVASPEYFNRCELAIKLKEKLEIKSGKIIKCKAKDLNLPYLLPLNNSLEVSKIIRDTNFQFTKIDDCLDKLKINYQKI